MHSEDIGLEPEILMHDRDTKFTKEFDESMISTGCEIKKTPIRSPNLQAHVERVVQTLKHVVLDEFVVVSEKHLNQICREAQTWYNNERGHSARENLPPGWEQPSPYRTAIRTCSQRSKSVKVLCINDLAISLSHTGFGRASGTVRTFLAKLTTLQVLRAQKGFLS